MPEADLIANVMITGLLTGMVYGLMALGLSVVFGVVRIVNFAHGELMTAAMYVVVLLSAATQLDPLWLMIPMGVLFFGLGYGLQRTLINRFIQRPEHSQLLLMLAIATILVNGLLMAFGPDAQSVQTDYQLDSFELGPLLIDKPRVYAATAAALTALALLAYFRYTTTGKAIRACADNHMGALVTGLPLKHLYALTFGLGTACVAIAGCAQMLLLDVTPAAGPAYTLLAFVIVIVGGLGSMAGALFGGVLIGMSEALAGLFVAPSAKSMFSFALLILILLVRPAGLLGARA
ncbi:MAG TPA: branched-chain amino acid ABC transporter permease [Polyangiales bacterium]|jgi:branched-chain amino acid transport system permease protein|nr:branched-chain amino acid ABC transporter permease [Polyangiales bacterium]